MLSEIKYSFSSTINICLGREKLKHSENVKIFITTSRIFLITWISILFDQFRRLPVKVLPHQNTCFQLNADLCQNKVSNSLKQLF